MGFDIGGTSEHVGLALPDGGPLPAEGLMLAPYLNLIEPGGPRVCYGVTSAGGGSLDWYANSFVPDLLQAYGQPAGSSQVPGDLEAMATSAPPGSGGLIFLPYLNGERAPIWDADARGVFFGLNSAHRHAHFARAVMEGVAFSLRQVLARVETAAGATIERVHASGGPARLALWNQIKADVLGRPLAIPRETHAACLGAAMLAAIGSGWYAGAGAAAEAMVQLASEVAPNPANFGRYDDLFAVYANLYPQLRGAYAQLAAINLSEETQT
jgi:sugar (pentulose or hexulose) kinase